MRHTKEIRNLAAHPSLLTTTKLDLITFIGYRFVTHTKTLVCRGTLFGNTWHTLHKDNIKLENPGTTKYQWACGRDIKEI